MDICLGAPLCIPCAGAKQRGAGDGALELDRVPRRQPEAGGVFVVQRAFPPRDCDGFRRVLVIRRMAQEKLRERGPGGENRGAEKKRQQAAQPAHGRPPRFFLRRAGVAAASGCGFSAFPGRAAESGGATSMWIRIVVPLW